MRTHDSNLNGPHRGHRHLADAESLLQRGDRAAAVESLEEAFRLDPASEEPALLAAWLQREGGNLGRAASLVLSAMRTRPFHPKAMNLLGVVCLESGRPWLAEGILERAVAMAPSLPGARKNLRDARRATRRPFTPTRPFPEDDARALLERRPPRLTACVLLRDREQGLEACLASVRPLAQEILVVDARTSGREGSLGAADDVKALDFDGDEDVAQARNLGLARATGDWVLVLDACEVVEPASAAALPRILGEGRFLYHTLTVRLTEGGGQRKTIRMFRNGPGVAFRGRAFERIHPALLALGRLWGLEGGDSPITILRGRPDLPWQADPRTLPLELRLVERDLLETPHDVDAKVQLAAIRLARGEVALAQRDLATVRATATEDPLRAHPLVLEEPTTLEGWALLRLGHLEQLANLMKRYHDICPATHNTLFLEGVAERGLSRPAEAAAALQRALSLLPLPSFLPPLPMVTAPGVNTQLGAARLDQRDVPGAREAFEAALRADPESVEAELGLLGADLAQEDYERALHQLDALAVRHGDDPRVWLTGASVFRLRPELAGCGIGWMEEARRRLPSNVEIAWRTGEAFLDVGRAEEALEAWRESKPSGASAEAAFLVASLLTRRDPPSVAPADREETSRRLLAWFERWRYLQSWGALDRALLNLPALDADLPGIAMRVASWLETSNQADAARRLKAALSATPAV